MQTYGGISKYNVPVLQQNLVENAYSKSIDVFQTPTMIYGSNNIMQDTSNVNLVSQSSQVSGSQVQKEQTYISEPQQTQPYASYQTINEVSSGMPMMNTSYRSSTQYAPYTTTPPALEVSQAQPRTVSAGKSQFAVPTNRPVKVHRRSRSASGSHVPRNATQSTPTSTPVAIAPTLVDGSSTIINSNHQPVERSNSLPTIGAVQSRRNRMARSNLAQSADASTVVLNNVQPITPQYNRPTSPIITTTNTFFSSESNSLIAQLLSATSPMTAQTSITSPSTSQPQTYNAPRQFTATMPQQYNFNSSVQIRPANTNVSELRTMDDLTFVGPKAPVRKISSPARISSPYISPVHSGQLKPETVMSSSHLTTHQALYGAASVKPVKLKSDQEKIQYKEHRRVCHINAEQKRRCNIKNGFDTLRAILPSISQNTSTKISKAAMLQKAAERIRALKVERQQQQEEYDHLKQQIESLNQTIRFVITSVFDDANGLFC